MLRITSIVILLLCTYNSFSQNGRYPRFIRMSDTIETYIRKQSAELSQDIADGKYFSYDAFDRFFDKYFTQLQYTRDNFTEGNSASLKTDDKTSVLNLTLSRKMGGSIFSLGTAVPVIDKSGVIFTGDKPSTGTELFGSFSYILTPRRRITVRGDKISSNWQKRQFLLDSLHFVYTEKNLRQAEKLYFDSLQATIDIPKFRDSVARIDRVYRAIYQPISNPVQDSVQKRLNNYRDSLLASNEKLFKSKEELMKLDTGADGFEETATAIFESADKLMIEKQLATDGITQFDFAWITGGLRYRRDKYSTYDSNLVFAKRIGEKNFDKWTLSASYNHVWQQTDAWLKWKKRAFISYFYFGFTWSFARANIFDKVKESDIALISTRTQNDSIYQFTKPGKLKNISGLAYSTSWLHTPAITITYRIAIPVQRF
jgi:hypothetical protein